MNGLVFKAAIVLLLSAASAVLFYARPVWGQASTYVPVGAHSAQIPSGKETTIAWVVDSARRRIIVCQAKNPVGDITDPVCKSAPLP